MSVANIHYVKKILDEKLTSAKKKYGQNFLIDANIVEKIAKSACDKEYLTIEIGPGIGALSEMLLKYSKAVIAYEIDKDMYEILKDSFNDLDVNLIDFLEVDLDSVTYKDEIINVCSNLPYYVTTPILFKLFESKLKINKITVMVQKEVAERFKARVGSEDYNALSIIVQYLYDVSLVMNVSRHVFYPAPKVDSAVISFVPKRARDYEFERGFFEFVKNCFRMRRKTLYNNLKDHFTKEEILKMYEILNLKESCRAQELELATYLKMYEVLNER